MTKFQKQIFHIKNGFSILIFHNIGKNEGAGINIFPKYAVRKLQIAQYIFSKHTLYHYFRHHNILKNVKLLLQITQYICFQTYIITPFSTPNFVKCNTSVNTFAKINENFRAVYKLLLLLNRER